MCAAPVTSAALAAPSPLGASVWPITLDDVLAAQRRIRPYLAPTPFRNYPTLDAAVGRGIRVLVKHENHQPTGAFKVRNCLSLMTALTPEERSQGFVAATRGNHGLGLAYAGSLLGAPVTVVVPVGNNPEKNEAMRALGARLIEEGRDYDDAVAIAARLVEREGLRLAHSTNDPAVIAGAGTMTVEMLDQHPAPDTLVLSIGGGSQAVGALVVARVMRPSLRVYGVQAAGADAAYRSWHAGHPVTLASATTFADGLATRSVYEMTFPALREGLAGFARVTDTELASALRLLMRTTHNMLEGAAAAGLAALLTLRDELAGQRVGIVLSGGNIDGATLLRVINQEI
jgi:threonine dehydratase